MFTRISLLVFIFTSCAIQKKVATESEPSVANLKNHVEYLSSDNLEGRRTGTAGEKMAAEYIATQFEKAGLQPKGTNGFYQKFDVAGGKEIGTATTLSINNTTLTPLQDFFPLIYSSNGSISARPSVSLLEKDEPWFLNTGEMMRENKSNPHFDLDEAVISKAKDAARKGATALFVYNLLKSDDALKFDAKERTETVSIPVVYVSKEVAKKYFSDPTASLKIEATVAIKEIARNGTNVIGYIDNGASNTVVLGAHFDHLGYGEDHNSRYTGTDKQIHNGADDNASGTAALIELARIVKGSKLKWSNYLFIAFSGEELGLFGSKYFTQNPTVDLSTINYMINMDMVGRLNDSSKTLTVGGYGTSPTWGELYSGRASHLFAAAQYHFDSSGTGPSDHTSFYLKNIPVLFYFTGLHPDYHKPTDDFDKINYTGEAAIVKHIYSLLQATDKLHEKVLFTKTRETQTGTTARFSVTLGIMPDYTFNGTGVRADGVSDGKPAQKAGLVAGDIITAIGDYKTNSLESYMQTLGKFKNGDKTTVSYTRGGKPFVTNVEFQ
ncbi:MAG: M28 family peptidase [Bacteroidota bacterium]|nr:M28 family peptidase [Bacteroidota bacterium]